MSFREKTAWISLLSMAGIYGFYFWSLSGGAGGVRLGLLDTIILLVAVQVVLNIAIAAFAPKDAKAPRDERDKLIEGKSARFAYAVLAACVALAVFFGAFTPPVVFNLNAFLFFLVMAEVLRALSQIVLYRRSA